jgi:hypothetical protein
MVEIAWSGREDSNLRPLPPEDGSPPVTARISADVSRTDAAHSGVCSRLIHGLRSKANLRPLSMGVGR